MRARATGNVRAPSRDQLPVIALLVLHLRQVRLQILVEKKRCRDALHRWFARRLSIGVQVVALDASLPFVGTCGPTEVMKVSLILLL